MENIIKELNNSIEKSNSLSDKGSNRKIPMQISKTLEEIGNEISNLINNMNLGLNTKDEFALDR